MARLSQTPVTFHFSPFYCFYMGDIKLSRRRFLKKMANTPAETFPSAESRIAGVNAGSPSPFGINVQIERLPDLPDDIFGQEGDHRFNTEMTLQGGLDPYQGPWTKVEAAHLLRRTTFGLKKAQLDQMLALGNAEAAVDAILSVPTAPPAPPINNYNNYDPNNTYIDPEVPSGTTWINAPYDVNAEGYRIESWRGWWLNLMLESEANIQEKMTLFWHNHFATKTEALFRGKAAYKHNQMLRENSLGNFKSFVKAVTLDPLMLYFLNGYLNNVVAPDENYARELQELFTVGKESAATYSEDDVVVAARVLTGWTFDANGEVVFYPNLHDQGFKVFSSFYNGAQIAGSSDGNAELDALLNMIFQKEEVSLFICREIYRFFVYYKIDAQVENDVIVPMAQIFRDNNYEILPVMRALLLSEHFFDAANKGCQIKNPLDLTVGLLRNYNLSFPSPTLFDQYYVRLSLNYFNGALQMLPGDPPNVAGWQAYRQSPSYYRMWISSDTIRNRNFLCDYLIGGVPVGTETLVIDPIGFSAQFSDPSDPNLLLDDTLSILFPMPVSALKKIALKSILLSGQASDHYWTDAWNALVNNPTDPMAYQTVWIRLALLHRQVLRMADYQLI
ncbi:MAG: DUF1800 domain-containing protein [Saprospiraceae bacterium]|nr:DUF1800 domain-containing protein [Saprospiraceae bacterium]